MNDKKKHVLNCAIQILQNTGDQGLSMRKLAAAANMSLSNVQYYYKNKDILLGEMLEGFLIGYADSLRKQEEAFSKRSLRLIITSILEDITSSNCGVLFKEIWAIAERNASVAIALKHYYTELRKIYYELLKRFASPACSDKKIYQAVDLLLPFVEGYCITSQSLQKESQLKAIQLTEILQAHITAP